MSNPTGDLCPACLDTKMLLLPSREGVDEFPCPCCVRWGQGFPGLAIWVKHRRHYIIAPSKPNELAEYIGKPDL